MTAPAAALNAAELAQTAAEYLAEGRRDVAELYARGALETDPRCAPALALLAGIERGLRQKLSAAAAPGAARYLLIREWSQGFWSDVDHVLGMCLLAEITGRIPVVWWGAQSRFSGAAGANAWEQFFAPVSEVAAGALEREARRFPAKWHGRPLTGPVRQRWSGEGSRLTGLALMERGEEVVVSDFHTGVKTLLPWLPAAHALAGLPLASACRQLVRKYLRPRAEIGAEAERFAAAHFAGRQVIAVHVRGSDKVEEVAALEAIVMDYFGILDERLRAQPGAALFLLTDDERVRALYRRRYGERVIATEATRSSSNVGVHYLKDRDPVRTGTEVLVDALLAARCSEFVGLGYSNVSLYATYLKDWPPGSCRLLGENAHELWNVVSLLMDAPPGAD